MPEPLSTIGLYCLTGYGVLNAYARGGSAVSCEAREAQKAAKSVVEFSELSQALFGEKAAALTQLWALARDCSEANWDGAGGDPLDVDAVFNTADVVRALPEGIPIPEFAPEPDGSVSLDWIKSRNCIFSLSVGAGPNLTYAWLDGGDRGHGVARFDGGRIPTRVLEGICGIMNHANPAIRPF